LFILSVLILYFYLTIFFLDLYFDYNNIEPSKEKIIKSLKWPWRLFILITKMIIEIFNEGLFPLPFTLLDKDYKLTSLYLRLKDFSKEWC